MTLKIDDNFIIGLGLGAIGYTALLSHRSSHQHAIATLPLRRISAGADLVTPLTLHEEYRPGIFTQLGLEASIGDQSFLGVLDTGSSTTFIDQDTADLIGIRRFPRLRKKQPYDTKSSFTPIDIRGGYWAPLTLENAITVDTEIWVSSGDFSIISPSNFTSLIDIAFHGNSVSLLPKDSPPLGTFLPYIKLKGDEVLPRHSFQTNIHFNIGGTSMTTLLDSGALTSFIPHAMAHAININRFPRTPPYWDYSADRFKHGYFIPIHIPDTSISYMGVFRPYAGELVILSAVDFLKKGFAFTMREDGADFYVSQSRYRRVPCEAYT